MKLVKKYILLKHYANKLVLKFKSIHDLINMKAIKENMCFKVLKNNFLYRNSLVKGKIIFSVSIIKPESEPTSYILRAFTYTSDVLF